MDPKIELSKEEGKGLLKFTEEDDKHQGIVNVRICLEFTNTDGSTKRFDHTYKNISTYMQRGIDHIMDMNIQEGGCVSLVPNGHERILIKAWSGCKSYDDFCSGIKVREII